MKIKMVDVTVDDARQIAFDTLRAVVLTPGWEKIKDLIGRELDITDEIMDRAVDLLFSDRKYTEIGKNTYYIVGKVKDSSSRELLGECNTPSGVSELLSEMKINPKSIFVIEGVKKDIRLKKFQYRKR